MQTNTQQHILEQMENNLKADGVVITYYTDPLCCWSWAFEPQWRKLLIEYGSCITVRYCMGGLLPSWHNYHDDQNSVSRPLQMGPVWMHAQYVSGMPIQSDIWMRDPPASSYPACVAVKAASLHSPRAETMMLRILREAVMINGLNIAKPEVLKSCVHKVSAVLPTVDTDVLIAGLSGEAPMALFRQDLQQTHYYGINRFPSFVITSNSAKSLMISGYQPYSALENALCKLGLQKPEGVLKSKEAYVSAFGSATERELAELAV